MGKEFSEFVQSTRPKARTEAIIQGPDYRFTVLTDRLIRLEYQPEGRFMDDATQCVICREFPIPEFRVSETEQKLEITTKELHLYYDKKPFSPEGLQIRLTQGYAVYGSVWRYGDAINDLRGTARTLDGADGAAELGPGLMSRGGFTVLDDSESARFDPEGYLRPRTAGETDLYFFGYGHDYLGCLRDFYALCGKTPLVPRYALGNWWSRFYPYTEESYLRLMDRFRREDIPIATAVIDMDWHLTDIPRRFGSGWTGYTWNPEYFPDPARFLGELHRRGLHVTLNLHPADGVKAHEDAYPEMARELGIDAENEDRIPFDPTDPAFVEAYFKYLHHPNEEIGVDFWWVDWQQGTCSAVPGLDPLWLLNHQHFTDSGRNGKLPMTFSRYAGIGSHRYPVGFSGDTVTTWESLAFQPYFTVNASNAGYVWWSHDIGGHMRGIRSDELTVRWVQFGVFSPIMRLHSSSSRFYGKEPWNYGMEAERVISDFMRLRHKLIPYLYTMDYMTAEECLPLMRPMYYHHDVREAYTVPNEYYFGTAMIVCPVTSPADARTRLAEFRAWLPEGTYFDFFTGNVYRGGKRLALYRPLDQIPVLVPAGSIIPLAGEYMESHISNPEVLEVQVWHGADGAFTLVEDDCSCRQCAPPQRTRFTYELTGEDGAVFRMEQTGESPGVIPEHRVYQITVFGIREPESVCAKGDTKTEWTYRPQEAALYIEVTGQSIRRFEVRIDFAAQEVVGRDRHTQIAAVLQRAQIEYELKDAIFGIVTRGRSAAGILASLAELGVERPLYGAIAELLTMDL